MNLQSCPPEEPSDSECRPDIEEGKGRKGSSGGDCFRRGTDLEGGREVSRRFDVGSPRQCQVKGCFFCPSAQKQPTIRKCARSLIHM